MSETPMQLSREERLFRQHALWHAAKDARIAELEAVLREARDHVLYGYEHKTDVQNILDRLGDVLNKGSDTNG